MGKIAFYTGDKAREEQLLVIGRMLKIQMNKVRQQDIGCTVMSVLAGNPQPAKGAGSRMPALYVQPEVLIFSGFSEAEFDAALAALRTLKPAPIPLKAVVTPYNCQWSVWQLTRELMKEHKAVTKK